MASIPLFPLNTGLFPGGHLPLQVFEVRYLDMVSQCIAADRPFGVVALRHGSEVRKPDQMETLSAAGALARVVDWSMVMPGLLQVQCVGAERFHIVSSERLKNGLWMAEVSLQRPDKAVPIPPELQNVADTLGALIRTLQQRQIPAAQMPLAPPFLLDECGWVANRWCELLSLGIDQRQRLLIQENPVLRLELVQDLLAERGMLE
ncbi:LON peptidase substrate-binding domain-containing protein [Janthinobacterium fluminis]|uniref:LON peptidase substrate-binding domain-containing protein n=1 Tax=Janthinobacterium fluminis TaxID=2987524 RepID=A0ABT5JWJ2_9BURK|nr:LON peptidase substrate-binding domain-containing protein [Janthinobacterium fluminis]MDC8756523.1 LON peptidase substrate-binding domain-containing protein [Janthinobacterium fluminis]